MRKLASRKQFQIQIWLQSCFPQYYDAAQIEYYAPHKWSWNFRESTYAGAESPIWLVEKVSVANIWRMASSKQEQDIVVPAHGTCFGSLPWRTVHPSGRRGKRNSGGPGACGSIKVEARMESQQQWWTCVKKKSVRHYLPISKISTSPLFLSFLDLPGDELLAVGQLQTGKQ